jgi:hypothetical protein
MGTSTFSKHDLEMIEISWSFVKNKESIGLNTMSRIFDSSKEIKNLFGFASSLESIDDILENTQVRYHGNLMINTMDKIVILLTELSLSKQDKYQLISLGQQHYHFGLKTDYFKVLYLIIIIIIYIYII